MQTEKLQVTILQVTALTERCWPSSGFPAWACNWRRLVWQTLPGERREDCYRRGELGIHTEAICNKGPGAAQSVHTDKRALFADNALVWHNEHSSLSFESRSEPLLESEKGPQLVRTAKLNSAAPAQKYTNLYARTRRGKMILFIIDL